MNKTARFGPGLLITAAFIGPGTVTTASRAGAQFGHALLWAVLLSIAATMILQEMSARLGLVSRAGLGEALRGTFVGAVGRSAVLGLVVLAIGFGNAAFEAGNLSGAMLGLDLLAPSWPKLWLGACAAVAAVVLWVGADKLVERLLIGLVVLMSLAFLATAVLLRPDPGSLLAGLVPQMPTDSGWTIMALIGTTVVPYNLFLHASAVSRKWGADTNTPAALRAARSDSVISIALGGAVTAAIMISAAACYAGGTMLQSAVDMANQLEPLLGTFAKVFFAIGYCAAGLTSTITAPLAAAFAIGGVLGWPADLRSARFRAVWGIVLLAGIVGAFSGRNPIEIILVAQAANGLLLPVMAIFLLVVVNSKRLLGVHTNGLASNIGGIAVVGITTVLGCLALYRVWIKL